MEKTVMVMSKAQSDQEWKYKVESAANTLIEAEKIKKDKKLMAAVREELKKRLADTQAAAKKT